MIKIDLLPQNLKKKERVVSTIPLPSIIFVVLSIIVFIHVTLFLLTAYKKIQFISLSQEWKKMQPQFKETDVFKKDLEIKKDKVKVMQYILRRNTYWTNFLNKINQAVPKGLWLNRLNLSDSGLVIEGSVFSFGSEQVSLMNTFFNTLKNDEFFTNNFDSFKLDSMQRRNIKDYEILDFLLTAQVTKEKTTEKTKEEKTKKAKTKKGKAKDERSDR